MNASQISLFILFSVPLVWSPGPVNIMLAGLGANHGIWKNLPFVAGLICSATLISAASLLGFLIVLQNEVVGNSLRIAGAGYIMYLAIKVYRLQPMQNQTANTSSPRVGFGDGLLVTLLNPKFYVMVTAVFAQFIMPDNNNAIGVCVGFILILLCAHIVWLALGKILGSMAKSERHLIVVNKVMGASLFIFAVYFLYSGFFVPS